MDWPGVQFFDSKQFDSPDLPGSGEGMKFGFVKKLDILREECGFPLIVDSGFRTPKHNAAVGGEAGSAHLTGEAADIRCLASRTRYTILANAYRLGFKRIGIGDTFIHLDDSTTLDQQVVWLYPTGTKKTL